MWQLNAPERAVFELPGKAQTTSLAGLGADLQRRQGVQKQHVRVCSVVTHRVEVVVRKMRIHQTLPAVQSGQLNQGLSVRIPTILQVR
jgi:hypothetical protein